MNQFADHPAPHEPSLRQRINRRLFSSGRSSLVSIVVLSEIIGAFPLCVIFAISLQAEGALTANLALVLVLMASAGFGVAGVLFWATFAEPLRKRIESKRNPTHANDSRA